MQETPGNGLGQINAGAKEPVGQLLPISMNALCIHRSEAGEFATSIDAKLQSLSQATAGN
jgi:hypothetical protein